MNPAQSVIKAIETCTSADAVLGVLSTMLYELAGSSRNSVLPLALIPGRVGSVRELAHWLDALHQTADLVALLASRGDIDRRDLYFFLEIERAAEAGLHRIGFLRGVKELRWLRTEEASA
jgi:hypothetical protein